jgi:adenine-specific DNA-methyltransferase
MRYLGNKANLLHFIDQVLAMHEVRGTGLCVCDPFAGTTAVARHFKKLGWRVVSGDNMTYSYAFQHTYIGLNEAPPFSALVNSGDLDPNAALSVPLHRVIAHLNNLRGVQGYFYTTYSSGGPQGRRYFTAANALRIDAIRHTINHWWQMGWLTEPERYLLLTSLIEAVSRVANVAGTYAAYLKHWDPRAHKPLMLCAPHLVYSTLQHSINHTDANELARRTQCDLLYLDPPYNTRQYHTNYHLLETLAVGDEPEVRGVAGLRPDSGKRSLYCQPGKAPQALSELVRECKARWILMSYNSEGIIPHEIIMDILSQRGKVSAYWCEYRRFRSDSDGDNRRYRPNHTVREMLYWVSSE